MVRCSNSEYCLGLGVNGKKCHHTILHEYDDELCCKDQCSFLLDRRIHKEVGCLNIREVRKKKLDRIYENGR